MKESKQFDWRYGGKCHLEYLDTNARITSRCALQKQWSNCD